MPLIIALIIVGFVIQPIISDRIRQKERDRKLDEMSRKAQEHDDFSH